MGLRADKQAVRERMRLLRDSIDPRAREAAAAEVAERLVRACAGRGSVMGFISFGSEIPTMPMLERLAREGHGLVVPHILEGELVPVAYDPGEELAAAVWGISEPADLRPVEPSSIDVVFAPGLAFDRNGFRLGYGGGFYDRLLARLRPDALALGVCFHEQVIPEVPHGEGDLPLGVVLTDRETIDCG